MYVLYIYVYKYICKKAHTYEICVVLLGNMCGHTEQRGCKPACFPPVRPAVARQIRELCLTLIVC